MRYSAWLSSGRSWEEIRDGALRAEKTGWDGIWIPDHFMPPEGGWGKQEENTDPELAPVHEAWTLVAAIAALTSTVRIGVLVSGNTYRHPAILAKMAATVDHISAGRAVLGLGAGWQENEHARYGITYGTAAQRSDWLEEAAQMITGLYSHPRANHTGGRYQLDDAPLEPKPIQERFPLMIGGGGERRTMRTAARYATEWNVWGTPEILEQKSAILDAHLVEAGRPAEAVSRSAAAFLELTDTDDAGTRRRTEMGRQGGLVGSVGQVRQSLADYESAGVGEIIVPDYNYAPSDRDRALDRFLAEVVGR